MPLPRDIQTPRTTSQARVPLGQARARDTGTGAVVMGTGAVIMGTVAVVMGTVAVVLRLVLRLVQWY